MYGGVEVGDARDVLASGNVYGAAGAADGALVEKAQAATRTVERMRKLIEQESGSRWEDGAVITWSWTTVDTPTGRPYTYHFAAVYVAGTDRWYVTGQGKRFPQMIDGGAIVKELLDGDAEEIMVATVWERV